jgi:hypothetical protein
MESHLLPAMNVLSLCAGPAMNMREEREIKLALNAKPDTSASKVRFFLYSCVSVLVLILCTILSVLNCEIYCR